EKHRLKNRFSRRFSNGETGKVLERLGGRTRARTWDPMIKSHLLYQLSYAPGCGSGKALARGRRLAKRPRDVQQTGASFPGLWRLPEMAKSRWISAASARYWADPGSGARSEPLGAASIRPAIPVKPVPVVAAIAVKVAIPAHSALVVPPASPATEPAVHMGQHGKPA